MTFAIEKPLLSLLKVRNKTLILDPSFRSSTLKFYEFFKEIVETLHFFLVAFHLIVTSIFWYVTARTHFGDLVLR